MAGIKSVENKFLIVIAGPTGIGKTDLSIQLAHKLDAEIFSADSRQIYKEMNIGTAKPSVSELKDIRHHFINEISIETPYSVGTYVHDFHYRLDDYFKKKNIAIIAGGTGLYLHAVLKGMDTFPDIPHSITHEIKELYNQHGLSYLQSEVKLLDPEYYIKVDIHNSRRLIRALEVIRASGRPYSSFLGHDVEKVLPYKTIPVLLELPRDVLYSRINSRVDAMLKSGLEGEVRSLFVKKHLRALNTVGYSELFRYFDGEIGFNETVELIKQNSRRYAKRQITWFKKYCEEWNRFSPNEFDKIYTFILTELKGLDNVNC